jgi:hypothetical protein
MDGRTWRLQRGPSRAIGYVITIGRIFRAGCEAQVPVHRINVLGRCFAQAGGGRARHPSVWSFGKKRGNRDAQVTCALRTRRSYPAQGPAERLYDRCIRNEATAFHTNTRLIVADSEAPSTSFRHGWTREGFEPVYRHRFRTFSSEVGGPSAVEADLGLRTGRRRCLFVGAFDPPQGLDTLLASWKWLARLRDVEALLSELVDPQELIVSKSEMALQDNVKFQASEGREHASSRRLFRRTHAV